MPFTTITYIAFFAIVFFTYYVIPRRTQWMLLLVASYVFYAWNSPLLLAMLFATTVVSYVSAVSRRPWMFWTALLTLVSLFLWGIFQRSFGWIVPIGLSFYCLQTLGYITDVYWGIVEPECNFFKHALFVSYFPQIMQGPIGNYGRLAPQLFVRHDFDYEHVVLGLQRVAWGFFKKLMIANIIADRINPVWNAVSDYPGFICWSTILFLYAVQLYADFSGYMDIACGCSQMLGIKLDENFNCPYFAKTIPEFWRRWHMTLSEWFKTYLFYPILRMKLSSRIRKLFKSKFLGKAVPTTIALVIVWATTGLWHGADWGYVIWGVYYGIFMILAIWMAPVYDNLHARFQRFFDSKFYAGFQMLRTFAIVCLGYAIFKPADLGKTVEIFRQMFSAIDGGGIYQLKYTLHHSFIKVFVWMALMFAVDAIHYRHENGWIRAHLRTFPRAIRWLIYLVAIWLMIFMGLYGSGFDQFEYFKF